MLYSTVSNVLKRGVRDMERMYSYDELASILGCTRTAIAKKIKPDENNPDIERYKNRYRVVLHEGKKCIVIDDAGLEDEKLKSRGFKNVSQNGCITPETQAVQENKPVQSEINFETVSDVTERYINRVATLYKEFNEEIMKRDKQILLLTVDEKTKQNVYLQTQAENTTLKEKYNVLEKKYNVAKNVIKGVIIFCLICITSFITFKIVMKNVSDPVQEKEKIEQGQFDFKSPEPEIKKTEPAKKQTPGKKIT